MHNASAVVAIEAPVAAPQRVQVGWLLRLPYPLRNAVGRWRALVSMILGVGIALSIGMTILGVISADNVGELLMIQSALRARQAGGRGSLN